MIDLDYWKSNYGITLVPFDLILAEQIGWKRSSETDACCLQNELAELVLDATERRYAIQQSLNNYADNLDTPDVAGLRTKLAQADAELRRYESLSNLANSLSREVEAEISNSAACEIQHEVDDETGDLYVSRASFERWLEKKKEAQANTTHESDAQISTAQKDLPKKVKKIELQKEAILQKCNELFPDPNTRPKYGQGKAGSKKPIREALKDHPLFTGHTTFDNAWEKIPKEQLY